MVLGLGREVCRLIVRGWLLGRGFKDFAGVGGLEGSGMRASLWVFEGRYGVMVLIGKKDKRIGVRRPPLIPCIRPSSNCSWRYMPTNASWHEVRAHQQTLFSAKETFRLPVAWCFQPWVSRSLRMPGTCGLTSQCALTPSQPWQNIAVIQISTVRAFLGKGSCVR